MEDGVDVAVLTHQGNVLGALDGVGLIGAHRQRDRDGPRKIICQSLPGDHALVVALAHETFQRGKRSDRNLLDVGKLAGVERDARHGVDALLPDLALVLPQDSINQFAAVRPDACHVSGSSSGSAG